MTGGLENCLWGEGMITRNRRALISLVLSQTTVLFSSAGLCVCVCVCVCVLNT